MRLHQWQLFFWKLFYGLNFLNFKTIKQFNPETDLHLQGKAWWGHSLPEIKYLNTSALGPRFDLKMTWGGSQGLSS